MICQADGRPDKTNMIMLADVVAHVVFDVTRQRGSISLLTDERRGWGAENVENTG